jgi:hypothetical protein
MSRRSTQGDDGQGRERSRGMSLGRTRWAIAGMILGVGGSSWVGVGHRWPKAADAPDVAADAPAEAVEETDGTIDGAVRKVSRGIRDASSNVRDRFDRAQGASRNVALVAEVKARLRQDKSLDADRIDVTVEDEGTVILKGQVSDNASKEMAVDLTRDIRGVVRVEDHLAVPPRTRVIAAASDDDPSTSARPRRTR